MHVIPPPSNASDFQPLSQVLWNAVVTSHVDKNMKQDLWNNLQVSSALMVEIVMDEASAQLLKTLEY